MQTLQELFKQPKVFVEKCQGYLTQLGFDKTYDYYRFFMEETSELINNHNNGKHINNRALLCDDLMDSIWTALAMYEGDFSDIHLTYDFYIEDKNDYHIYVIQKLRYNFDESNLVKIINILINICNHNNIDIMAAFGALCEENMSKLPPNGSSKEFIREVYRDGKCNKKDYSGKLYSYYKHADFSKF